METLDLKSTVFETCRFEVRLPLLVEIIYIRENNFTSFLLCLLLYIRPRRIQSNMNGQQFYEVVLGKWRNGRRAGLRNQCLVRVGSSPTLPIEDRGFGIPHIETHPGRLLFYLIFAKINLMSYWAFMSSRIQTNS